MTNILEYTLSLQDKMSSKLRSIGINSDSALSSFAALQSKANVVNVRMNEMGRSVSTLRDRLSLLRSERDLIPESQISAIKRYNAEINKLSNQVYRLENISGGRFKRWTSDAFNQIPFANLITNPLVMAGTVAAASMKKGFENEKYEVAFNVMLGGDESKAQKLISDIKKFGAKTPYETKDIYEVSKMLLNFGIANEKVMPSVKMLGDIAMGDSEKLKSLSLAFSQMSSAGKLNGQDLLQMINAGFNPLQEISKKTGKSMGTLRDEMSKGKISSSMVTEAFKAATEQGGRYYQMTEKMSKSGAGKFSNLMDSINNTFISLYDLISPIIIPVIDTLTSTFDKLQIGVKNAVKFISDWKTKLQECSPVVTILTGVVIGIASAFVLYQTWTTLASMATKVWTGVQAAFNAVMAINPVALIVLAVIALIAAITFVIMKTEGWGKTWKNVTEYVKLSFQQMGAFLNLKWLQIQDTFLTGFEVIKTGWFKLKALWDEKGAAQGLAKISDDRDKRAVEIAKAKGKVDELSKARKDLTVWEVKWNDKKLSDVTGKLKTQLGINSLNPVNNITDKNNTGNNNSDAKTTASNISTGGTRNTQITIHLGKFFDNIVLQGGAKENANEIYTVLEECFVRVLASAESAG